MRKRVNRRKFCRSQIETIPNVPGVYEILDSEFNTIYVGKSNHVRDRLLDHLGEFKGAKYFRARFMPPKAAEKVENKIIRKKKPKYNKRLW
jgi:excinuclease UvrABC nuclease subunit